MRMLAAAAALVLVASAADVAPFAGECANGQLVLEAQRTQDNHCGACDAGFYLGEQCGWFGRGCVPVCIGHGGACANGQLKDQALRTIEDECGVSSNSWPRLATGARGVCAATDLQLARHLLVRARTLRPTCPLQLPVHSVRLGIVWRGGHLLPTRGKTSLQAISCSSGTTATDLTHTHTHTHATAAISARTHAVLRRRALLRHPAGLGCGRRCNAAHVCPVRCRTLHHRGQHGDRKSTR